MSRTSERVASCGCDSGELLLTTMVLAVLSRTIGLDIQIHQRVWCAIGPDSSPMIEPPSGPPADRCVGPRSRARILSSRPIATKLSAKIESMRAFMCGGEDKRTEIGFWLLSI